MHSWWDIIHLRKDKCHDGLVILHFFIFITSSGSKVTAPSIPRHFDCLGIVASMDSIAAINKEPETFSSLPALSAMIHPVAMVLPEHQHSPALSFLSLPAGEC